MTHLSQARVVLIGAGGLGSAAGLVLARSGVGAMTVLDDDRVDASNLHRQLLYGPEHEGQAKAPIAAERLEREARAHGHSMRSVAREIRALPDAICDLIAGHDVVVEGADNFATKFMAADAARLVGVPVVQAGAVRWIGWAKATAARAGACLRCIFEDIPRGRPETCAEAGVVGPVVGALGALQAALCLRLLSGDASATDELWNYQALPGVLRSRQIGQNPACPLCTGEIETMDMARYMPPDCAA